jgi:hypothetical protein
MRPSLIVFGGLLGSLLSAQTATTVKLPEIKWRGAIWTSAAASNRQTTDGSLFLRTVDAGDGNLALDGLQIGGDVSLAQGWSFKFTLLGGRTAKVLNDADGEQGSLAYPEAQLVWTGEKDTFKVGRMSTFLGIEYLDCTQDITYSRGLLFTYAIPFSQVGVNWHHAFNPSWSTDAWILNGEDRVRDNNRGKTWGLGLNYNHGGATDKYVSLMAYRGPEQDGLGSAANTGAEGRQRERICFMGQWVWGASTLQWEADHGRETFLPSAITGATGTDNVKATWSGLALIYKYQWNDRWAGFARAEYLKDNAGIRLNYDTTVAATYGATLGANLAAKSVTVGVERKWGQVFTRFELRQDELNRDVHEVNGKAFRSATSATWGLGASF